MPLFSLAELQAKATGRGINFVQADYARAYAWAEAQIISYCRLRYENPDESASKVLKQIGLDLALFHAASERYNEQSNPAVTELWAIRDGAIEALKAVRKGDQTADAASVETSRNDLEFKVRTDANGNDIAAKFSESEMSNW